jgi:WD40 repeat protein
MSELASLHDYGSSSAVLIGTWNYDFMNPVPAARNSLQRMAKILTGPLCGWPADRVQVFGDEPDPGSLPDRLVTAFEGIKDVALFYYVGHGQIDADDQLCLSLVKSRTEFNRRATTSLMFQSVRRSLLDSEASTKIVILDCCFADLANRPSSTLAGLAEDLLDKTSGTGAYTMAATGAYTTAWYETDSPFPQTYFTKYLVDLVEAGIPGQPAGLRVHAVFNRLRENLVTDGLPAPRARSVDGARDFIFAWNAAPAQDGDASEDELERIVRRLAEAEAKLELAKTGKELNSLSPPELENTKIRRVESAFTGHDQQSRQDKAAAAPNAPDTRVFKSTFGPRHTPVVTGGTHWRRLIFLGCGVGALVLVILVVWLSSSSSQATPPVVIFTPSPSGSSAAEASSSSAPPAQPSVSLPIADAGAIAFSPDGTMIAADGYDASSGGVKGYLWHTTGSKLILNLPFSSGDVNQGALAFSPDGDTLAADDGTSGTELVNIPARRAIAKFGSILTQGDNFIAFSPNGHFLATADSNGYLYLWDVSSGSSLWDIPLANFRGSLAFSKDGQALVGDGPDGIDFWSTTTGQVTGHLPGSGPVAFSPDGSLLALGDGAGDVRLWSTVAKKFISTFTDTSSNGTSADGTFYGVNALAFSPDSTMLALGADDGNTYLLNWKTGKIKSTFPDPNGMSVDAVAFSPDGKLLASGSGGGGYLWKLNPAT